MNRAAFVIGILAPVGYLFYHGVKVMQEAGL